MITIDSEEKNTQQSILRKHFEMLYPDKLKDDEWIRLIGIRKDETGSPESTLVKFIKTYEEYEEFVFKYRYTYDLYNQIATNKGNENGNARSQRCRKVLYMDFDQKDYPNITDAEQFTELIKSKIPKLFLIACVNSGHGYHFYVSIKQSCKIAEITKLNKELVEILGADPKAALSTQIARIPCSYNHKCENGIYDYLEETKWTYVKVVNNAYKNGPLYKPLDLNYIYNLIRDYNERRDRFIIFDKEKWDYSKEKNKCYFCVKKVMNEGIEKGQRNFWHGRIVNMLREEGYSEANIFKKCLEYNARCIPSKSEDEIKKDTERFLKSDYKLLGCYNAFPENSNENKWIGYQCDQAQCDTYYNGAKISVDKRAAVINKKILTNKDLRKMKGNDYLIITLLYFYRRSYGRNGFRIRNLKDLLYSDVTKKHCISDITLKSVLQKLVNEKWITITPDKTLADNYWEQHIGMTDKLKRFQSGYITFYFTVSIALIDGKITQKEYLVFITLARNFSDRKNVTYEQLSEDLNMDKHNIQKCIKNLQKAHCLIVDKEQNEKGREYNRYSSISPVFNENIHLAV